MQIDTSKRFSDKTRTAIVIIGILTIFNTIALIVLLGRGFCNKPCMYGMMDGDIPQFEQMMGGEGNGQMPIGGHR